MERVVSDEIFCYALEISKFFDQTYYIILHVRVKWDVTHAAKQYTSFNID